jgi:hypothetical protein
MVMGAVRTGAGVPRRGRSAGADPGHFETAANRILKDSGPSPFPCGQLLSVTYAGATGGSDPGIQKKQRSRGRDVRVTPPGRRGQIVPLP